MESKMDQFREFVSKHPLLRDEVRSGKRSWQNIYEEWVLYGEGDKEWEGYKETKKKPEETKTNQEPQSLNDSVKNILSYVQKINPDSLNKTLNSVQKVVQIAQSFGGKSSVPTSFISSAYNDWWD